MRRRVHDRMPSRLVVLGCLGAAGFGTAASGATPASDGITLTVGQGTPIVLITAALDRLPTRQVALSFMAHGGSAHGPDKATFEGPLLWTVLDEAGAIGHAKPGEQGREIVLLTGHDGYTAILGLGEIAPSFEGKSVILADRMDGHPLGAGHFRIVVPGDQRAARSVRDLADIAILAPHAAP